MTAVRPPASAARWVAVLGEDLAIEAFLALGGARRQLAANPRPDNAVVRTVGMDAAKALYDEFGIDAGRVPLAKPWIAQVWHARGIAVSEIARQLHVADKTVRGWVRPDRAEWARAAAERAEDRAARADRRAAERAKQIDLVDWLDGRRSGRR